jgi:hypothetical protein
MFSNSVIFWENFCDFFEKKKDFFLKILVILV